MNDNASINFSCAWQLIDGLSTAGVEHAVVSPGSRSTPLVLASDRHPGLTVHVLIDERSAGFFALGIARCVQQAVVLIATSGSAAAHWYPAVLEADRAGIPLILLSADRPPELRDWGANQTIDQVQLFGARVRAFHDAGLAGGTADDLRAFQRLGQRAVHESIGWNPGPVHINLPFREPLVPTGPVPPCETNPEGGHSSRAPTAWPEKAQLETWARRMEAGTGIIVCGPGAYPPGLGAALRNLAETCASPVLADPLSGLRFGSQHSEWVLCHYDAFLRSKHTRALLQPAWILRFGTPPVSRVLTEFIRDCDVPQALVAPRGDWMDPTHRAGVVFRAAEPGVCQALAGMVQRRPAAGWWTRLREKEVRAETVAAELPHPVEPFEGDVIRDLMRCLPPGSLLLSGNSLPIRQLDTWSGHRRAPLRLLANRGVSGIEGTVSTLLGAARVHTTGPVVGLLGDVSLVHDINGLLAASGIDATLIVVNNGGGGIFGYLPQASLPEFERYWLTPPGLEISDIARLHRLGYRRVERQAEFEAALRDSLAHTGVQLIEVVIDRELSMQRQQFYWDAVNDDAV